MNALSEFLVKEGPFRGAYQMDGRDGFPDMRKAAGLGTCNCCDYFIPRGAGVVVLAEKTRLMEKIGEFRREFTAAPSPEKNRKDGGEDQYINNRVMWRNRLKVYGGMLVLCRYAAQSAEVRAMLEGKKFRFLLVDDGKTNEEEENFEHWKQKLLVDFRGLFSPEMLDRVNVIRAADLAEELPEG